jgi:hypothetical protein
VIIIAFIFQKLLEPLDGPGMQPAGPRLRLPDLGPHLFQRLVLKVVPLEQFPLFFRELLDGRTHAAAHLLELNALVGRQPLVGDLQALGPIEARAEHHGQPGDRARDALHLVLEAAAPTVTV